MKRTARTPTGHRVVAGLTAVALVAVCCGLPQAAQAAVPHLIRYQGTAVDSKQVPLEGPYTLTFRLYDAQTGGTKQWEETQPNVPINGGYFSVLLGQVTALNVDWSKSLWLSVQVGTDPELLPRQRITSVPLAIVAEQLAVPVATSTITDDANRLVPSGAVILWTGTSCPTGYTRLAVLDGKFLAGGTSYNASAGGTNTVTPSGTISAVGDHTHTVPIDGYASGGDPSYGGGSSNWVDNRMSVGGSANEHNLGTAISTPQSGVAGAHAHSFSGTAFDNRPEFATLLLCQKN